MKKILVWFLSVSGAAILGSWLVSYFGAGGTLFLTSTKFYPPSGYLYNQAEEDADEIPDHKELILKIDPVGTTIRLINIDDCKFATLDIWGQEFPRDRIGLEAGKETTITLGDYHFTFNEIKIRPHRSDKNKCSHLYFVGSVSKT